MARALRAPECLLTDGYYNYKMDMWGVGCVMFEVVALFPLFPGARALTSAREVGWPLTPRRGPASVPQTGPDVNCPRHGTAIVLPPAFVPSSPKPLNPQTPPWKPVQTPGSNELDQIQKIHNVLGTPPPSLLAKLKRRSQHMQFDFPQQEGTGVAKLLTHCSPECQVSAPGAMHPRRLMATTLERLVGPAPSL
jgi:serine/threonine protein kinase